MDDTQDLLAGLTPSTYLADPETATDVRIMLREAARFWRNSPWERLPPGPMALQAPDLFSTTSALGLSTDPYPSAVLTHSYEDYLEAVKISEDLIAEEQADIRPQIDTLIDRLDEDDTDAEPRREALVTVSWVPASHVTPPLRKEFATNAWEVASPSAYPIAVNADPRHGIRAPSRLDLRRLAAAFAALSTFLESRQATTPITAPFWHAAAVEGSPTGVVGRIVYPHPHHVRAPDATYRYEAELGPDRALMRDGIDATIDDIAAYHTERRPHPMPETARMHGMLHFAAESQLFSSSDKARADLERMLLAGMSRHEAIHRMGVPLVERVIEMLDIMRSPPRRKGRKTRSTPKNKPTAKKKLTGKKKR